jgi:A/G-specific adenine glycosylase
MLHEAGKTIAKEGFPKTTAEIQKLPGVGPYTARAVMAFAHNADEVFIETNIRTAILHHFFSLTKEVTDEQILTVLKTVHPKGKSRAWYAALMDYGSALKQMGVRLNPKVKGYVKQSTFQGSTRQARGAILKALVAGPMPVKKLISILGDDREEQVVVQINGLYREKMIEFNGKQYSLPK